MRITKDNWPESWGRVPAWTPISDDVYNHFLNVMPPASQYRDRFQSGEPYDHAEDSNGRFRARYLTFADCGSDGKFYLGKHFRDDYPMKDTEAIKKALEE